MVVSSTTRAPPKRQRHAHFSINRQSLDAKAGTHSRWSRSCCSCGGCCGGCCCFCWAVETWKIRWKVASLLFLFCLASPLSPFFSLSLPTGSPRPSFRRGPVRPHAWLLARFCAVPWRSACVVRGQHGSTTRFATTSCVCSTRGTHDALNLHLLLPLPWAPTLFLSTHFSLTPPELWRLLRSLLLSRLLRSPSSSSPLLPRILRSPPLAPRALSSPPLAPRALSSPRAPPALSSPRPLAPPALSSFPHAPHALSPHPQDLAVSHIFSSLPL